MGKRKEKQEDYGLEMQESFERWAYLYEHGGSDPFYEDGFNLNLVRNHLHYYRGKIEETMTPENYPEVYFKDMPPEVDDRYMARPDEIRAAARASLKTYKADPNYLYVVKHYEDFSPKTREKLYIDNILGYVSGLERYIQEDKLVDMRRHEKPERYTPSFEECVKKMRETPQEAVQLSFFLGTTGNAVKHDSGGDFEMD